ncbi:DEAD box helicase [Arthroderma uncinatum]|uniref:DEAD box helicase n=1 Tax=Arthroderma uncinatum TaxID=74035 RepID=UPI00144A4E61|nr:DEAD box helicase [Arthroderma uncinatum]KAF3482266.1 DEAD box helicase [Arthroderma uncinatum]
MSVTGVEVAVMPPQEPLEDMSNLAAALPGGEESAALAREKGWVAPQRYNYDAYNTLDKDEVVNALPWASNSAKYEWKEEYGDIGPPNEELEKMLFQDEYIPRVGKLLENLRQIEVTAETTERPDPIKSFDEAGLHPITLNNIKLCGYVFPTPVQAYCIPAVMTGHDLIAVAQTGSGKTAAFLIPVLSRLMGKAKKLAAPRPDLSNGFNESLDSVRAEPLVLIVVPTRELATQIFDEARRLCYRSMLRPCVIYGGGPTRDQRTELMKGCDILIATPGRLIDFMDRPNILTLCRVRYTIIDEADELLQADWEAEFTKILAGGDVNEDADHRYMMFSATFNRGCRQVARKFLANDYVRIRIGRVGSSHLNVTQQVVWAEDSMKKKCLYDLLMAMPPSRTIVFVNTKPQADLLDDFLFNMGLPSTSIHSDRTQREREDAIRAFKTAKSPILIATAVSARGLDIKNVMHVVNYDLPSISHGGIDEYIHRIGRTARIGNQGLATSFYNERNSDMGPDLVKILMECNQAIPDFLQSEAPPDGVLKFDDDTDDEAGDGDNTGGAGDAWGAAAAPAAAVDFTANAGDNATATDAQGAWPVDANGDW